MKLCEQCKYKRSSDFCPICAKIWRDLIEDLRKISGSRVDNLVWLASASEIKIFKLLINKEKVIKWYEENKEICNRSRVFWGLPIDQDWIHNRILNENKFGES